jgi:hypothetical protein
MKQAQAEQKPSGPPDRGKTHYYMCIADEHERRAAQAWLDRHFKNDPRLVTELKIDRLYDDSTVSVLVRRPFRKGSPKASVPLVADGQGIKETAPREDDELAEEIEERNLIVCRDYWADAGTEDREGELNVSRFLEAIGKTSIPATVKYRDDQRILRFGWA